MLFNYWLFCFVFVGLCIHSGELRFSENIICGYFRKFKEATFFFLLSAKIFLKYFKNFQKIQITRLCFFQNKRTYNTLEVFLLFFNLNSVNFFHNITNFMDVVYKKKKTIWDGKYHVIFFLQFSSLSM